MANPLATFLSTAMLLRDGLGLADEAARVEAAVEGALDAGLRTADLMTDGADRGRHRADDRRGRGRPELI